MTNHLKYFFCGIVAAKSGIDPSGCVELVKHVKLHCPNLEFSGLMTIGMPDYSSTPENFKVTILLLYSELTVHRTELTVSCFSQNLMQVVIYVTMHFICIASFLLFCFVLFFVFQKQKLWFSLCHQFVDVNGTFICMLGFVKVLTTDPKALGLLGIDLVN